MRSLTELAFRARQELVNARMAWRPPRAPSTAVRIVPLVPDPTDVVSALRATPWATEVVRIATELMAHRFPLLGLTVDAGSEIRWRRDPVANLESPLRYWRRISYLDLERVGDFKLVFELNRHHHLVLMAQAWRLTQHPQILNDIWRQIESWLVQNPFGQGINWTSALEAAHRVCNWLWTLTLAGDRMPERLRHGMLESLYRHGLYIEANLSYHFSPNTHLIGEAAALHALGHSIPEWPAASRWREIGHSVMVREIQRQVMDDGAYFEQSSHYHTYATDIFLFHRVVAPHVPTGYDDRLRAMLRWLDNLMAGAGNIPLMGDDDGGRWFHPFGARDRFARGTLAAGAAALGSPEWLREASDAFDIAAWWVGPTALRIVPRHDNRSASVAHNPSGVVVLGAGDVRVIVDAGPMGAGAGAHSHADALSLTASVGSEEVLIDAGTGSYVDPKWRALFRGTAAHSTIRVAGRDQAKPVHAFRWAEPPHVKVDHWASDSEDDLLVASCHFRGIVHRRICRLAKAHRTLLVLDFVYGEPSSTLEIEQFWHPAAVRREESWGYVLGNSAALVLADGPARSVEEGGALGWRSRALGHHEPAPVIRVVQQGALPMVFAAALDFSGTQTNQLLLTESESALLAAYGPLTHAVEDWARASRP